MADTQTCFDGAAVEVPQRHTADGSEDSNGITGAQPTDAADIAGRKAVLRYFLAPKKQFIVYGRISKSSLD